MLNNRSARQQSRTLIRASAPRRRYNL